MQAARRRGEGRDRGLDPLEERAPRRLPPELGATPDVDEIVANAMYVDGRPKMP